MCMCVYVCVHVCVRVCMIAGVCVSACSCAVSVLALRAKALKQRKEGAMDACQNMQTAYSLAYENTPIH